MDEENSVERVTGSERWYKRLKVWGPKPPIPETREICPEYSANFFSRLTFEWMTPSMITGYRRPLEVNDIWLVNPKRRTKDMADKLKTNFLANHKTGRKNPLMWAIVQTFKIEVIIGAVASFISSMLQVLVPYVVKYIISFATEQYNAEKSGEPKPRINRGVGLVIGITIMQIFSSIGYNHFFYTGMMVGGQARSALISMIFDKAMTISGQAKAGTAPEPIPSDVKPGSGEEKKHFLSLLDRKRGKDVERRAPTAWSNGRIVTLMSVDTSRVDRACGWFHMGWSTPLGLIVTTVLLLVNLSYSALVGLGLFFTATPFMTWVTKAMLKSRGKINRDTDQRTSLMQEALQAIRFIKYYAWEDGFLNRLDAVREREVHGIRSLLSLRNAAVSMGGTIPIFSSMLTFITYSLTDHALDPASVFSSLALFNQLRLPLILFPTIVGMVSDAMKALERLEDFLLAEDSPEESVNTDLDGSTLEIREASFTWEQSTPPDPTSGLGKPKKLGLRAKASRQILRVQASRQVLRAKASAQIFNGGHVPASAESVVAPVVPTNNKERAPFTLNNIALQAQPNELIAVVGTVGSGKTSLLSAIAGEMRRTSGFMSTKGRRAFCTQVAWIQNATIRDNITFGQEFNQEKYDLITKACSLEHDLQILPHGSNTEIGERGINLSGGQKQRISLARAIYFDADLVLLDDPLGAVDAHVGEHIMEHAICGLLKNKCRLLVTHQLHFVPRCDRVVIMDKGKVVACDTFDNLMATNTAFQQMMVNVTTTNEKQEETEEGDEEESLEKKITRKAAQDALMTQEKHAEKGISGAVYLDYFRATGSVLIPPFLLFILCSSQAANILTSLWLAWWSDDRYGFSSGTYIGIYAGLGGAQGILLLGATLGFTLSATTASKRMLHESVQRIFRTPTWFFDTVPLGRIMNRYSKDIDVMDNNLSETLRAAATTVAMVIGVFALTISYYYYFAAALVPLMVVYFFSAAFYHASALEVKRHESLLRSKVYARFNEAIVGTATIRAYGVQDNTSQRLVDAIDDMDSAYFLTFANQRWIGVRLDVLGVIFIFVVGMLVITNEFKVSPSISGLVLSYLVSITQALLLAVRQVADAANNMQSVERVWEYTTEIPQEASAETKGIELPASWPQRSHINFQNVDMRYRDGLPLVLHDFNIEVQPGERIGIVGRTGAGKSSIMAALFRMVELSGGSICIDGVDISTVGLRDLRSRMAIIPQDPTLFRGTVRYNLDPFGTYPDADLWSALRRARLVEDHEASDTDSQSEKDVQKSRITLESAVEAEGANFSVGQRQLMSLARALVRDSRIIICDEATSAIDFDSDAKVQAAMTEGFKGKTVLCIAHRLKTIIGYDRVCLIDNGQVSELGTPLELYDQDGQFRAMCDQSQITREEIVAQEAL